MGVLFDSRGNEIISSFPDQITGGTLVDARSPSAILGALNAETIMDLAGQSTIAIDLRSVAFTGTVVFEATIDGTNYFPITAVSTSTQQATQFLTGAGVVASTFVASMAAFRRFRVRVSAYTSGTITVAIRASIADQLPRFEMPFPATLWVTATAAANTAATASLPAAGAGLFHYITHIDIVRNATAALAGTATIIHTTTNLPGTPAWSVGNAMAAGGTQTDVSIDFSYPLRSSAANVATTVVAAAAGLAVLGRVNVGYFVGA